jgi:hypothetical protein
LKKGANGRPDQSAREQKVEFADAVVVREPSQVGAGSVNPQ